MSWPIPGVTHAVGGSGGAWAHGEGRAGFHPNLQRIMLLLERLRAAGKRLRLAVSSALGSEVEPTSMGAHEGSAAAQPSSSWAARFRGVIPRVKPSWKLLVGAEPVGEVCRGIWQLPKWLQEVAGIHSCR